ncbi:hypothetical protein Sa4125_18640 [Aureimonas sp. SA4125]|uniref:RcnB family protein n=1 Tax=Aureimonas sp. SA4125 TaxID=2826993 RepID=UPI001CC7DC21|nr:RcnB family protein [Aureimonas sp. SA4125]BDA84322.1 hypothetical protein Sa4125_18640 [Aureimonas sp. SA4125]
MKKTLLTAVAMMFLASPVLTAASASAQSRQDARQELRQDRQELRQDRRELQRDRKEVRQDRKALRRAAWVKRGGRYQSGGRNVSNYRQYGLKAPARGQRWVRYNNDYLLVSIASGVIAGIVAAR